MADVNVEPEVQEQQVEENEVEVQLPPAPNVPRDLRLQADRLPARRPRDGVQNLQPLQFLRYNNISNFYVYIFYWG